MKDFRFWDPRPEQYPITLEFFRTDTKDVVFALTIAEPGVTEIPALAKQYNAPIGVRITDATGAVQEAGPGI